MMRIYLIRAAATLPVRNFLLRNGGRLERALQRAQLPPRVFDNPEMLLPHALVGRFFREAARVEGIETLGAQIGQATSLAALGVFGRRIVTMSRLVDAVAYAAQIAPLYSGETFWLEAAGNDVRLRHRFPMRIDDRHQQLEQFSLCSTLGFLKSIAAPSWRPTIHLKKGMPCSVASMPILRDSAIVFDASSWAVTFPRWLLRCRLPTPMSAPPTVTELGAWRASAPAPDLAGGVAQVVATALASGDAGMDVVARWIGTSMRTLQRRLKDSGVSYAELLAKARCDAAIRLLDDRTTPLHAIALKIGYSDPAHFTRAFRRWTGDTPRTFRERHDYEPAGPLTTDDEMGGVSQIAAGHRS